MGRGTKFWHSWHVVVVRKTGGRSGDNLVVDSEVPNTFSDGNTMPQKSSRYPYLQLLNSKILLRGWFLLGAFSTPFITESQGFWENHQATVGTTSNQKFNWRLRKFHMCQGLNSLLLGWPRKLQHTPGAHPRQSPYPTMKGFPLQPVRKGLGVCSKGVLKQP